MRFAYEIDGTTHLTGFGWTVCMVIVAIVMAVLIWRVS